MHTKKKAPNQVSIVTLGCSKNVVDSEVIVSQLNQSGIMAQHEQELAPTMIINTCGFIESAKQESIDTILHYSELKEKGDIEKLIVTGCLSQRYKDELRNEIPNVDHWFGTMELPSLLKSLNANYKKDLIGERNIITPNHYAYLKIAEGCDRPCSFCAIPIMRGKHRSKSIEFLVKEATHLVKNGVKELMLIAQDSTYYGLDLYGKRNLAELLKNLANIKGLEWIRIHYAYPAGFPEDVLHTIAEYPNICNYLDIPLQHVSDKMLKIMRRGLNKDKTEKLLTQMREIIPNLHIRTTFLIGHPGETEEDQRQLLDFIEKHHLERVGAFTYSHEDGTHSYSMEDAIEESVKEERKNQIMELQQSISYKINQQKIGSNLKVIVDSEDAENYFGRTEFDSPEVDNEVIIPKKLKKVAIGDFVTINIKDANEYDLVGTVC